MDLCQVKVSAPGKVILHGEHSVVYGEIAVACSLALRTKIFIQEIETPYEPIIEINFPSVGLNETLLLNKIFYYLFEPQSSNTWKNSLRIDHASHLEKVDRFIGKIRPNFDKLANIKKNSLRGFFYLFSKIFGHTNLLKHSIHIEITSDLTVGAGTGSSASFAVCSVAAFLHMLKLKCGSQDKVFSSEDMDQISAEAFNCEKIMHGAPSGIDNTTCTFGSLVSFRKGEEPRLIKSNVSIRILLVDTKVSRETKNLVSKVSALKDRNSDAVECVMKACGHVANTAIKILKELSHNDIENLEAKYQHLADLWNMNHCLLASLGVSHPALEDIRATTEAYELACKLTGAGGGGHAIVLVPPQIEQSKIDALMTDLKNKGYAVKDTMLGGVGVSLEEL